MLPRERLDRQLRIAGWNQSALETAWVAVVGDDDLLASLYLLAAAALGLNRLVVLAPALEARLLKAARNLNPDLNLVFLEGYLTHPWLAEAFSNYQVLVDLSSYGLSTKILMEKGFRENLPVIRGFGHSRHGSEGFQVFTYRRGREWAELAQVVAPNNFPGPHFEDPVLAIIAAGLVLEDTKNLLLGWPVAADLRFYERRPLATPAADLHIGVVGAGALGNFVGLGLALAGFRRLTFLDPDVVEATNLNRQVLLYEALGRSKAEALAARLTEWFGVEARGEARYLRGDTDITAFDVVFDCVDNFPSRIVAGELCRQAGKPLISGGTGVTAGQVIVFDPAKDHLTPAELLGLYDLVDRRQVENYERERASCLYQPEPAVVMTNQIIAGFMVESLRLLLSGQETPNRFYEAGAIP